MPSFYNCRVSACLAFIALNLAAQQAPHEPASDTPPAAEEVDTKRIQAYRILDNLDTALKKASRTDVDNASLIAKVQELRRDLNRAVDDDETAEVTRKASSLMHELAVPGVQKVRPAVPSRVPAVSSHTRAAAHPAEVVTPAIRERPASAPEAPPTSYLPLIFSGVAILFSIAAVVISPILCKAAVEKTLRSAGLQ